MLFLDPAVDEECISLVYSHSGKSLGGAVGEETTCQCRRLKRRRFNPSVGKIPPKKEMATHFSIVA